MSYDFETTWQENEELVPAQARTVIYQNADMSIVLMQEAFGDEQDQAVIIHQKNVRALIAKLEDFAERIENSIERARGA